MRVTTPAMRCNRFRICPSLAGYRPSHVALSGQILRSDFGLLCDRKSILHLDT